MKRQVRIIFGFVIVFLLTHSTIMVNSLEKNKMTTQKDKQNIKVKTFKKTILTKMNLEFTNTNKNDKPMINSDITFRIAFRLPERFKHDYYEFKLPDNIVVSPFKKRATTFGSLSITEGKVIMIFNKKINAKADFNDSISFQGRFNEKVVTRPGETTIKLPSEPKVPPVKIDVKPQVKNSIDKKNIFDKALNPNKIKRMLTINKSLETIESAIVKEKLTSGSDVMDASKDIKIFKVKVDLYGNVINGSQKLISEKYKLDNNGIIRFEDTITDAYQIEYQTTIDDKIKPMSTGGVLTIVDETKVNESVVNATMKATYKKLLDIKQVNYQMDQQVIDWRINYNFTELKIKDSQAYLTNTVSTDLKYVPQSMVIHKLTFNRSGNSVQDSKPLSEGKDYSIIETANGFVVQFLHDIDYAINLDYRTKVAKVIEAEEGFSNTVDVGTKQKTSQNAQVSQQSLLKNIVKVDYNNNDVKWKIAVNKNNYLMESWKLENKLSPGLRMKSTSLQIKDLTMRKALKSGIDYRLVSGQQKFKIEWLNKYQKTNHTFEIVYQTTFKVNELKVGESFKSSATANWNTSEGATYQNIQKAVFKPNKVARKNGYQHGKYDTTTKKIAWSSAFNYKNESLKKASLVVSTSKNQQFNVNSLKLYHYSLDGSGNIIKGREFNRKEYAQSTIEKGEEIKVAFKDKYEGGQYLIEFTTTIKNKDINKQESFKSRVRFYNKESVVQFDDQVTILPGRSVIEKQDNQDSVNWEIIPTIE